MSRSPRVGGTPRPVPSRAFSQPILNQVPYAWCECKCIVVRPRREAAPTRLRLASVGVCNHGSAATTKLTQALGDYATEPGAQLNVGAPFS